MDLIYIQQIVVTICTWARNYVRGRLVRELSGKLHVSYSMYM